MPTLEEIRADWRRHPRNTIVWEKVAHPLYDSQGECKGEWVAADGFGYQVFLKPGKTGKEFQTTLRPSHPETKPLSWPVAAYEKIAADLAYDLGLPVPAARVWERPDAPDGYCHYAVLSLGEFPHHYPTGLLREVGRPSVWATPRAAGGTAEEQTPHESGRISGPAMAAISFREACAAGSPMLAFDTWLGQQDRGDHPHNVLYGYDPEAPSRGRLVFLDFGRSMNWSGAWEGGGWSQVQISKPPSLILNSLDRGLLLAAIQKMEDYPKQEIHDSCERLVGPYFTDDQAKVLVEGLVARKAKLRSTFLASALLSRRA
jgi:hypothetical protein